MAIGGGQLLCVVNDDLLYTIEVFLAVSWGEIEAGDRLARRAGHSRLDWRQRVTEAEAETETETRSTRGGGIRAVGWMCVLFFTFHAMQDKIIIIIK